MGVCPAASSAPRTVCLGARGTLNSEAVSRVGRVSNFKEHLVSFASRFNIFDDGGSSPQADHEAGNSQLNAWVSRGWRQRGPTWLAGLLQKVGLWRALCSSASQVSPIPAHGTYVLERPLVTPSVKNQLQL